MPDISIDRQEDHQEGRYSVVLDGVADEAELTYRILGDRRISADHTYVPPEMRSHGIALKLVERLVADARAEGRRIRPRCSYVAAQFQRHPDWEDVLDGGR